MGLLDNFLEEDIRKRVRLIFNNEKQDSSLAVGMGGTPEREERAGQRDRTTSTKLGRNEANKEEGTSLEKLPRPALLFRNIVNQKEKKATALGTLQEPEELLERNSTTLGSIQRKETRTGGEATPSGLGDIKTPLPIEEEKKAPSNLGKIDSTIEQKKKTSTRPGEIQKSTNNVQTIAPSVTLGSIQALGGTGIDDPTTSTLGNITVLSSEEQKMPSPEIGKIETTTEGKEKAPTKLGDTDKFRTDLKQTRLTDQETRVEPFLSPSLETFSRPTITLPSKQEKVASSNLGEIEKAEERNTPLPSTLGNVQKTIFSSKLEKERDSNISKREIQDKTPSPALGDTHPPGSSASVDTSQELGTVERKGFLPFLERFIPGLARKFETAPVLEKDSQLASTSSEFVTESLSNKNSTLERKEVEEKEAAKNTSSPLGILKTTEQVSLESRQSALSSIVPSAETSQQEESDLGKVSNVSTPLLYSSVLEKGISQTYTPKLEESFKENNREEKETPLLEDSFSKLGAITLPQPLTGESTDTELAKTNRPLFRSYHENTVEEKKKALNTRPLLTLNSSLSAALASSAQVSTLEEQSSSLQEVDKTGVAPLERQPSVEFGQNQKEPPVGKLEESPSRLGNVGANLTEKTPLEETTSKLGKTLREGSAPASSLEEKTPKLDTGSTVKAALETAPQSNLGAITNTPEKVNLADKSSKLGALSDPAALPNLQDRQSTLQFSATIPPAVENVGGSSLGNSGKTPDRIPPIPLSARQKDPGLGERGTSTPGAGANRAPATSALSQTGGSRLGTGGSTRPGQGANRLPLPGPAARVERTELGRSPIKFIPPPPVPEFGKFGGAVVISSVSPPPADFADYIVDMDDYVLADYVKNPVGPPP